MLHRWVLALLCITATVSGLAGAYVATSTSQPSREAPEGEQRALLNRKQSFPPSERWPGNTREPLRNVLFEEAAPNSQWLAEEPPRPAEKDPEPWSAPVTEAHLEHSFEEQPTDIASDAELAIQSDVTLVDESTWETPASLATPEAVSGAALTDDQESMGILSGTEPTKPSATPEDSVPAANAELLDIDFGRKDSSTGSWSPAPQLEPTHRGNAQNTLL